jgi:leader peptidase (prepilin peptidase)/N-methyltransferase
MLAGVAVEVATGWRFAGSSALPAYLLFGAFAVLVSLFDLVEGRLPNKLVLPAYPVLVALLLAASAVDGRWPHLLQATFAMLVIVGLFGLVALVRPGGLGLGDVKLAGIVGLACGYLGSSVVVAGVFIAFVTAAAVLLVLRICGRRNVARLAFAPFMMLGSVLAVLVVR